MLEETDIPVTMFSVCNVETQFKRGQYINTYIVTNVIRCTHEDQN